MAGRHHISNEIVFRIARQAEFTLTYAVLMAVAGVLAAVALLANSIPILIGAMIVAPGFPPLALVAFAMVGGQYALAWQGLRNGIVGIGIAVACAIGTTAALDLTGVLEMTSDLVHRPLLEERVRPGWYSAIAAAAAGIAGTIATVKDKLDSLIGTVASVALVPAACAGGIAIVAADAGRAIEIGRAS